MPSYQSLYGQLTDFPAMPSTEPGKAYHWAACANAALAEMNRRFFPATSDAFKTAINNLENSWNATYANEVIDATLQRSKDLGNEIATRVANWAATDGSANANPPYTVITGPGKWEPTAPPPAVPVGPYSFQRRKLVPGVADGTALAPLPAFSTTPGSPFYNMVNELYANYPLNNAQKALVDYYKDIPGYGPGGSYVAIMTQALDQTKPSLDFAALTYAKVGISQFDATTVLFTDKYQFLVIRPVTYIRAYIDPIFTTYIPTPNHPEFPSGHSTTGGAALEAMSNMFGDKFPMTLHIYDYLGYPTRSYTSFTEMLQDISLSRLYGGLHYRETLVKSEVQGRKVAQNVMTKVKFKK